MILQVVHDRSSREKRSVTAGSVVRLAATMCRFTPNSIVRLAANPGSICDSNMSTLLSLT